MCVILALVGGRRQQSSAWRQEAAKLSGPVVWGLELN